MAKNHTTITHMAGKWLSYFKPVHINLYCSAYMDISIFLLALEASNIILLATRFLYLYLEAVACVGFVLTFGQNYNISYTSIPYTLKQCMVNFSLVVCYCQQCVPGRYNSHNSFLSGSSFLTSSITPRQVTMYHQIHLHLEAKSRIWFVVTKGNKLNFL